MIYLVVLLVCFPAMNIAAANPGATPRFDGWTVIGAGGGGTMIAPTISLSLSIRGYNFKWGHRVVLDPVNPEMIYITTYGGSVWHGPARPDPATPEDIPNPVPVAR
jgi:hypothetical protein